MPFSLRYPLNPKRLRVMDRMKTIARLVIIKRKILFMVII
jgi:hypothetical protein